MSEVAKLFKNGRSQAVRLPAAFRFESDRVYIRRDPETGDVICRQSRDRSNASSQHLRPSKRRTTS